MKSRRQSPDNPVESVELRVSIKTDRATAQSIKRLFPSAKLKQGTCELTLTGERPDELAAKAGEMLEGLRSVLAPPKGFKNQEKASKQE
ncbi:MAG: hypothetical protein LYZ70_03295 [Nitrososphaerales archaeon]|nr:hypothetical protein [Nitrososphaerales archaeon]